MKDLDRSEILLKLERRHEQLLDDLDSLDKQVNLALSQFAPKSTGEASENG